MKLMDIKNNRYMFNPVAISELHNKLLESPKVYLISSELIAIDMESLNFIDVAIDEVSIDKVLEGV
ncbi:MAG: hypothetical protein WC554_18730 [Clostridia bacterium]